MMAATVLALQITATAAERVRYEDISSRIAPFETTLKDREIDLTLTDGSTYHGNGITFKAKTVSITTLDGEVKELNSDNVARISIRNNDRRRHLADGYNKGLSATFLCETPHTNSCTLGLIIGPPILAGTIAATPFVLIADAVASMLPPHTYEITH